MKRVAILISMFALLAGVVAVAPQAASAAPAHSNPLAIPITSPGGAFTGTFTLTGFALQNGALVANGIVSGTDANGVSHFGTVTAPVSAGNSATTAATSSATPAATASCSVLSLVLGPINLNVLGLQVTTNQIMLNINAIPGAGNLLGNLLCDVANLLNSPNATLVGLLNQIVAILQSL